MRESGALRKLASEAELGWRRLSGSVKQQDSFDDIVYVSGGLPQISGRSRMKRSLFIPASLIAMALCSCLHKSTPNGPSAREYHRTKAGHASELEVFVNASRSRASLTDAPLELFSSLNVGNEVIEEYMTENPTFISYHLLMFYRHRWPELYDSSLPPALKARILTSALQNLNDLSDFAILQPGRSNDLRSGVALKELGSNALPWLVSLLKDKSDAPLFGSEQAMLFDKWQYRRCDFAYRYVMFALGRNPDFAPDIEVRDQLITDAMYFLQDIAAEP